MHWISLCRFLRIRVNKLLHEKSSYIWEMNSPITNKCLWKLLSSFHLCSKFAFVPSTSMCSQMSLLRHHKKSDAKLLNQQNGLSLWGEYTHQKIVSQKPSLRFVSAEIKSGEKLSENLLCDFCIHLTELNVSVEGALWYHCFCAVWEGYLGVHWRLWWKRK